MHSPLYHMGTTLEIAGHTYECRVFYYHHDYDDTEIQNVQVKNEQGIWDHMPYLQKVDEDLQEELEEYIRESWGSYLVYRL
mgnify:CR=1 FL=1